MLLFVKKKIVKKLSEIIDLKLSYYIIPELTKLNQKLKKYHRSEVLGTISYGPNVHVDFSSILLVKKKTKIIFEGENRIGRDVEIQPDNLISIGYGTSIQDRNILLGDVQIGRYCLTAPNVYMSSGNHFYKNQPENYIKNQDQIIIEQDDKSVISKPIVIEDDVWIGINSVIMRGVKVGKGAIIGSNSVVTKNVNPYEIVVGNPARVIKKRLEFSLRKELYFSNFSDLPYFYSGFLLDKDNLDKSMSKGGIFATSSFVFYLDVVNSKRIQIELKNISSNDVLLNYEQALVKINKNEIVLFDELIRQKNNFVKFNIENKGIKYEPILLIKSVKVI